MRERTKILLENHQLTIYYCMQCCVYQLICAFFKFKSSNISIFLRNLLYYWSDVSKAPAKLLIYKYQMDFQLIAWYKVCNFFLLMKLSQRFKLIERILFPEMILAIKVQHFQSILNICETICFHQLQQNRSNGKRHTIPITKVNKQHFGLPFLIYYPRIVIVQVSKAFIY